jgi:hypothetical protein
MGMPEAVGVYCIGSRPAAGCERGEGSGDCTSRPAPDLTLPLLSYHASGITHRHNSLNALLFMKFNQW